MPFNQTMGSMRNNILVVDDDPDILEALKVMLEDQGYSVETAQNGNILQFLDQTNLPSMIILDVMLSGMDGRNIAEKLRKKKETKEIPIVMISANPGAATDCVKRGANAFLAKPFEIDDLLNVIHRYVPKDNDS
jgi:two-component system alkaline phosphatase synthesis response regulator PhoP